ncbi:AAA family ATPase, partial [Acinetobacter baumannii]|nr:AAA family ATPase [Acinetobacter baumannii]
QPDFKYHAKDRSGKLEQKELPYLDAIAAKILA